MNRCDLIVSGARSRAAVRQIRWELFVHREIRDVLPTERRDTVAVLYDGDVPNLQAWRRTLEEAGWKTGQVAAA